MVRETWHPPLWAQVLSAAGHNIQMTDHGKSIRKSVRVERKKRARKNTPKREQRYGGEGWFGEAGGVPPRTTGPTMEKKNDGGGDVAATQATGFGRWGRGQRTGRVCRQGIARDKEVGLY